MVVFEYRKRKTCRIAACGRLKTKAAFHNVPAIASSTWAAGRLKIYFFAPRLTDVGNVKVPCLTIKGGAPRVTQTERPNFRTGIRIPYVWVTWRNRVRSRVASFDVDPHDLTTQDAQVVSQIIGGESVSACAQPEIQITIDGTESQLTSPVAWKRT